jgi:hypothetical protein
MTTGCSTRSMPESAPSAIGRITPEAKPAGERRTGNPCAPFDRAGAGDGRIAYRATLDPTARACPHGSYSQRERHDPMTCPCGESLKCIRRHAEKPARDEYQCDVCGRIFYRYQINERW